MVRTREETVAPSRRFLLDTYISLCVVVQGAYRLTLHDGIAQSIQ
jgi:hypothetical protein